ncbi:translation initiation factor eIF-2B subunit delta [Cladophialophora psammophila CBS 110553]|uniref:Translation initiation factor eIF2B subunit delta n=1 Tax=Cladophialophora psammophila CBS 110553 TaxID=1182543 RepID=W9WEK2_9EURO|nr:translation initiation factor eIF-2B subunit delta [Cladophialophora psammophila CBS 110553]EXJ63415.1 translation initiation factor eIF-2B subunit delta [Cladophialophora psammophila CBS 110553]
MAESKPIAASGNILLNPEAASFTMPSPGGETLVNGTTQNPQPTTANGNGQTKDAKKSKPRPETAPRTTTEQNVAEAGAGAKLTGAQLKKQKAAEKAARRAEKVAEKGAQAVAQAQAQAQGQAGSLGGRSEAQRRPSTTKRESDAGPHHKRTLSGKILPIRGAVQQQQQLPQGPTGPEKEKRHELKRVPMFSHLYPREKKATLSGAGREIHPAVISLGLQLRDYVICGGNARCVATLLAFKKVIQTYTTPPGVALSRHLLTHLNHQIAYLRNARPLCMSQGNSIRWLKNLISTQPVEATDSEAKQSLCQAIDLFIRERITLADEVIAREASSRIQDGDVVVTYGKSSIVEKTLLAAHQQGKSFKVIVVDSRPMFEGKNHAQCLIRAGLKVHYSLLSGLADILDNRSESVTKCLLGASAMLGNGRLLSRAGSAMVAMMAKESNKNKGRNVPVIVLCETVKFTAKAALDSIIMNELGEPDALVETTEADILSSMKSLAETNTAGKSTNKKPNQHKDKQDEDDVDERNTSSNTNGLEDWRDQPNLFLLNLMYDVTPAEFLDLVVCELGSLPPRAVPVVNGVHGDDQALA